MSQADGGTSPGITCGHLLVLSLRWSVSEGIKGTEGYKESENEKNAVKRLDNIKKKVLNKAPITSAKNSTFLEMVVSHFYTAFWEKKTSALEKDRETFAELFNQNWSLTFSVQARSPKQFLGAFSRQISHCHWFNWDLNMHLSLGFSRTWWLDLLSLTKRAEPSPALAMRLKEPRASPWEASCPGIREEGMYH